MILGVFSDTHGNNDAVGLIYTKLKNADAWVFLGDGQEEAEQLEKLSGKPVYKIKGNCDQGDIEKEAVLVFDGVKVFALHGHTLGVGYDRLRLCLKAKEEDCAVALYGHTHVSEIEYMYGITLMCPGSPSLPRRGRERSFAKLEISNGIVKPSIIVL